MKAIIEIEQFDNGISLKWDAEGQEHEAIVAMDRDKEAAIGKMIWSDVINIMNADLTNTVRMIVEYEPIKEESHD